MTLSFFLFLTHTSDVSRSRRTAESINSANIKMGRKKRQTGRVRRVKAKTETHEDRKREREKAACVSLFVCFFV